MSNRNAVSDDYTTFVHSLAESSVSNNIGSYGEVINKITKEAGKNSVNNTNQTINKKIINSISDQVEEDKILVGEIVSVSEDGNGVVSIQDDRDHINIGEVKEGSVGERVRVHIGGEPDPQIGYCLTQSVIPSDTNIRLPPIGTVFKTELTRVSNSGNGIIEGQIYTLNVGPVIDFTGGGIKIKRIHQNWGLCLTDSVTIPNYHQSLGSLLPSEFNSKDVSEIISQKEVDKPQAENESYFEDNHDPSRNIELIEQSDISDKQKTEPELESSSIQEDLERDVAESNNIDSREESKNKNNITKESRSSKVDGEDSVSSQNLAEKRKKAEEAANESPEIDITKTVGSNYSRSAAIKDYAKTRANGVCEYCEKPAPFETDDGEPYLEAHHVDELGEGGEDHPDKVVALCPSCHKEIHYGQQGDKMNQILRKKLDNGLAEVGD